jgi:hypothetical protein
MDAEEQCWTESKISNFSGSGTVRVEDEGWPRAVWSPEGIMKGVFL